MLSRDFLSLQTLCLPLSQALDRMWSRAPPWEAASRSREEAPGSPRPTRSSPHCWMRVKPGGEATGWSRSISMSSLPVLQLKIQYPVLNCTLQMEWGGRCSVGGWVSFLGQHWALIAGNVLSIAQRQFWEGFPWFSCSAFGISALRSLRRCPQKWHLLAVPRGLNPALVLSLLLTVTQ